MNLAILGIRDGKFSLVYLSPEMLLDSDWNQILLKSDIYQQKVCAIAIDEVHLLLLLQLNVQTNGARYNLMEKETIYFIVHISLFIK
jgi:hypothetical protein